MLTFSFGVVSVVMASICPMHSGSFERNHWATAKATCCGVSAPITPVFRVRAKGRAGAAGTIGSRRSTC